MIAIVPQRMDTNQRDIFGPRRQPVMAAWGAGVDSTAMLIELITRGETVDVVLFANTGSERPETYEFIPIFTKWLADHGVPFVEVRYERKDFKN